MFRECCGFNYCSPDLPGGQAGACRMVCGSIESSPFQSNTHLGCSVRRGRVGAEWAQQGERLYVWCPLSMHARCGHRAACCAPPFLLSSPERTTGACKHSPPPPGAWAPPAACQWSARPTEAGVLVLLLLLQCASTRLSAHCATPPSTRLPLPERRRTNRAAALRMAECGLGCHKGWPTPCNLAKITTPHSLCTAPRPPPPTPTPPPGRRKVQRTPPTYPLTLGPPPRARTPSSSWRALWWAISLASRTARARCRSSPMRRAASLTTRWSPR